jgi:hypothetical protein
MFVTLLIGLLCGCLAAVWWLQHGQYEGTAEGDTVFFKATRKTRKVGPQGREEDILRDMQE